MNIKWPRMTGMGPSAWNSGDSPLENPFILNHHGQSSKAANKAKHKEPSPKHDDQPDNYPQSDRH